MIIEPKENGFAKKCFRDVLMEENSERVKTLLTELIEVAQEIIAEFDAQVQNGTLEDEMGLDDVLDLCETLDDQVEALRDIHTLLPWNWTIPEFDPEMVKFIFGAVEIMEEANAPFFVKWFRNIRRALDKFLGKP